LRCARKIEEGAIEHARKKGCSVVCCGHTHHAAARCDRPIAYYNSGCWTELPCTYLTVRDGQVELHLFDTSAVEGYSEQSALAIFPREDQGRSGLAEGMGP